MVTKDDNEVMKRRGGGGRYIHHPFANNHKKVTHCTNVSRPSPGKWVCYIDNDVDVCYIDNDVDVECIDNDVDVCCIDNDVDVEYIDNEVDVCYIDNDVDVCYIDNTGGCVSHSKQCVMCVTLNIMVGDSSAAMPMQHRRHNDN